MTTVRLGLKGQVYKSRSKVNVQRVWAW